MINIYKKNSGNKEMGPWKSNLDQKMMKPTVWPPRFHHSSRLADMTRDTCRWSSMRLPHPSPVSDVMATKCSSAVTMVTEHSHIKRTHRHNRERRNQYGEMAFNCST